MSKYASVLELIGNTPVVRLSRLFPDHDVWLKLERANPGGSVKDRIALQMVLDAVARGDLKKGGTIIEPTSGNTGVGLAMVSAVLGFRMILVMPESMSVERRLLAQAYGAELVLTPAAQGMKGAVDRALLGWQANLKTQVIPRRTNCARGRKLSLTSLKGWMSSFRLLVPAAMFRVFHGF